MNGRNCLALSFILLSHEIVYVLYSLCERKLSDLGYTVFVHLGLELSTSGDAHC